MLLVFAQFRVDGQRKNLAGRLFADRKVALFIPQTLEASLLMERKRVVDLAADLALCKKRAQLVPTRSANYILVEDRRSSRVGDWQHNPFRWAGGGQAGVAEQFVVAIRETTTVFVPPRKVAQLDLKNSGLN